MISKAESHVVESCRSVLRNMNIGCADENWQTLQQHGDLFSALEYFVPEVLAELYSEWEHEGLDGVFPCVLMRTGENEIGLLGVCVLITDQTLSPLQISIQIHSTEQRVSWLELRLGEADHSHRERMVRRLHGNRMKELTALEQSVQTLAWAYEATYGERELAGEQDRS